MEADVDAMLVDNIVQEIMCPLPATLSSLRFTLPREEPEHVIEMCLNCAGNLLLIYIDQHTKTVVTELVETISAMDISRLKVSFNSAGRPILAGNYLDISGQLVHIDIDGRPVIRDHPRTRFNRPILIGNYLGDHYLGLKLFNGKYRLNLYHGPYYKVHYATMEMLWTAEMPPVGDIVGGDTLFTYSPMGGSPRTIQAKLQFKDGSEWSVVWYVDRRPPVKDRKILTISRKTVDYIVVKCWSVARPDPVVHLTRDLCALLEPEKLIKQARYIIQLTRYWLVTEQTNTGPQQYVVDPQLLIKALVVGPVDSCAAFLGGRGYCLPLPQKYYGLGLMI